MTQVLKIVARSEGFRRAGYRFGKEPVIIPLEDLKEEQITALKSESELVVIEDELKEEKQTKKK